MNDFSRSDVEALSEDVVGNQFHPMGKLQDTLLAAQWVPGPPSPPPKADPSAADVDSAFGPPGIDLDVTVGSQRERPFCFHGGRAWNPPSTTVKQGINFSPAACTFVSLGTHVGRQACWCLRADGGCYRIFRRILRIANSRLEACERPNTSKTMAQYCLPAAYILRPNPRHRIELQIRMYQVPCTA